MYTMSTSFAPAPEKEITDQRDELIAQNVTFRPDEQNIAQVANGNHLLHDLQRYQDDIASIGKEQ